MRKLTSTVLALTLIVALSLRLYPTFASNQPFSTDAWSPIRNAEVLAQYTPISLDDSAFDGYNSYWPANSIFGVILSLVVGAESKQVMSVALPVVGAVSALVFFALVKRLFNAVISLAASVIFATAFTHAIFTAGVTKETYANPLYLALLLLFLHPGAGTWKRTLLFTVTSVALVLAHHLTVLVTIVALSSIALAEFIGSAKEGSPVNKSGLPLVAILAMTAILYYQLYARAGLKIPLTLRDLLSVASYQLVAFALAAYFIFRPPPRSRTEILFMCFAAATLPLLLAIFATKTPLVLGAPVLPRRYLLYAAPLITAPPLAALGCENLRGLSRERRTAVVFWFASILGLEGYAVFGSPDFGLILAYRCVNFVWPPLAVLCAVGFHWLYSNALRSLSRGSASRLVTAAAVLVFAAMAFANFYGVYAAVSLGERYMGYFWLYTDQEYKAGGWVAAVVGNQSVAGDVKVSSLLESYFNIRVDVLQGLRYLAGRGPKPWVLFVYDQMLRNGYVLHSGISVDLPEGWVERAYNLSLIYSSRAVAVYAG